MFPVFQNHFDGDAFSYQSEDMNFFIFMNENVNAYDHEMAVEEYNAVFSLLNIPDVVNYEVVGSGDINEIDYFYEIMMTFIVSGTVVTLSDVQNEPLPEEIEVEVDEESKADMRILIVLVVCLIVCFTLLFRVFLQ